MLDWQKVVSKKYTPKQKAFLLINKQIFDFSAVLLPINQVPGTRRFPYINMYDTRYYSTVAMIPVPGTITWYYHNTRIVLLARSMIF